MKSEKTRYFVLALVLLFVNFGNSQILFESTCQSFSDWDQLDMEGDGGFRVVKDMSLPPGYGPNVLEMFGKNIVLIAKEKQLQNGTLVALWKDMEPQKNDADGIMLFRTDLPQDISMIHNVKRTFAQYWIEQDFDSGTSIRYRDENTSDRHIALLAGKGLTYDTTWNPTGWFWQKVQLDEKNINIKFWSVTEKEPDDWALTGQDAARLSGRFGVRGWSARFRLAHFQASFENISVVPPLVTLFTPELEIFSNNTPDFKVFLNADSKIKKLRIQFSIIQNEKELYSQEWTRPNEKMVVFVSTKNSLEDAFAIPINFPHVEKQLPIMTKVTISDMAGHELGSDSKLIIYRSNEKLVENIKTLKQSAQNQKEKADAENNKDTKTASLAAMDLLNLANERLEQGHINLADKDINFANQLLQNNKKQPHGIQHPGDYSLRFKKVELSSSSFVMGNTYHARILWHVSGQPIKDDLEFRFDLCNKYGISAFSTISKKTTSQWGVGEIEQFVEFKIPQQISNENSPSSLPEMFVDDYFLCVTVSNPAKKEIYPWMLLDNPEAIRFFRLGQKYVLVPVYITFEPVGIVDINMPTARVLEESNFQIKLANYNSGYSKLRCAVQIETKAGTILYQQNKVVNVSGEKEIPIDFSWLPAYKGVAQIKVHVYEAGRQITKAVEAFEILGPAGVDLTVEKNNFITGKTPFLTRLNIGVNVASEHSIEKIELLVRNKKQQLLTESFSVDVGQQSFSTELAVQPHWGYYILECRLFSNAKSFTMEKKIVATVVETRDGKIYVNGEPFIMKGVNVHGLYGNSRELSSRAMEIMKDYGYNTLRGDHPNLWLVDLAEEKNMVWMVLNEFSCASTEEVFERFVSGPLRGVQEISRQFITAYRDHAGVLFWNSCNEIGNDLDEFLLTLYPCFKVFDPYNRPVNYANLYGQDNWRGQDIMGINYYFDRGQRAIDRQPIITKSIQVGEAHNLPVIYTEFNSFQGCSESAGLESIRDMGEWGLKVGMSGGTFYKLTDVEPIHPGLLDSRSRLEIHKPLGEQIKAYHADATVRLISKEKNKLVIEIQNKRDFYLRDLKIQLYAGTDTLLTKELSNIPPKVVKTFVIAQPVKTLKVINEYKGVLSFVTHFGLENKVDVRLFVP